MKKIDFEFFGPGQYLYFDIGRLIQVENITGKKCRGHYPEPGIEPGDPDRSSVHWASAARHQESPVVRQ